MPPVALRYGYKVFLDHEPQAGATNNGFVVATDNQLLPVGVRSNKTAGTLRLEHAVFQLVSGDGEVNLDITQRRQGEEIKFGQVVRLLHVTSNSFLCESRRLRASREKANQKVVLGDFTSEELRGSRWRVVPRYKVRSEGQKICHGDVVVFQSLTGDTTLHVCSSQDNTTDHYYEVNSGLASGGFRLQVYDMNSAQGEGRELRCGDCIQLLHREERAFFVGHQCRRPFSELFGPGLVNGVPPSLVIENAAAPATGATPVLLSAVSDDATYDEVVLEDIVENQRGGPAANTCLNSNSMFVVEADKTFAGGSVNFGSKRKFRLKSLATGRYLCALSRRKNAAGGSPRFEKVGVAAFDAVTSQAKALLDQATAAAAGGGENDDDDEDRRKSDNVDVDMVVILVKQRADATMLYFDQAADDVSTTARSHSRVFVVFPQSATENRWLGCSNFAPGTSAEDGALRRTASLNSMGGLEAGDHAARNRKYASCAGQASYKDGVELIKVPRADFQALNFILSQLPPVQRLIAALSALKDKNVHDFLANLPAAALVSQVRENLQTLGRLCTFSSEENVLLREGTPNPVAQNRLVDQGVPALCLTLVEAVFASKFVTHSKLASIHTIEDDLGTPEDDAAAMGASVAGAGAAAVALKYNDLQVLLKLCFRVMRLCSLGNRRTAMNLAPHVDRIFRYVDNPYGAFEALAELYADNLALVLNDAQNDRDSLSHRFVELCRRHGRKSGNPAFMLSLLAACRGSGVASQQEYIGNELLARDLEHHAAEAAVRDHNKPMSVVADFFKERSMRHAASTEPAAKDDGKVEPPIFYRMWLQGGIVRIDVGRRFPQDEENDSDGGSGASIGRGSGGGGARGSAHVNRHNASSAAAADVGELLGTALEDFASRDWNDTASRMGSRASFSMDSAAAGNAAARRLLNSSAPAYPLLRQAQLLTALARSRNMQNIARVRELWPTEVVLSAIKNDKLPGDLRSAFIELLVACNVDVPPFRDETEAALSLVRVWDEIPADDDPKQHQAGRGTTAEYSCESRLGAPPPVIQPLKEFLRSFFTQNAALDPYDKPQNLCVTSGIKALVQMVRLGLVNHDEFLGWIQVLTPVLDGRDDAKPVVSEAYRRKYGEFQRYRYDEDNHQLMVCKLAILEVFEQFGIFARAVVVSRLVIAFRQEKDLPKTSTFLDIRNDEYLDKKAVEFADERESRRKKAEGNFLQQGFGAITDVAGAGLGAMQGLGGAMLSLIPGQKESDHPMQFMINLLDVLFDIAQYEYEPLVISAVDFMLQLLNSHRGVLRQLRRVQILQSPKSVVFYESVAPTITNLHRFRDSVIASSERDTIVSLINQLTKALVTLRPKTERHSASASTFSSPGKELEMEFLRDAEQHAILKNLNAHVAVAQVCRSLFTHATGGDPSTGRVKSWVRDILNAAYEFLDHMVTNSKPVAWDLFPFAEVLSRHLPLRCGSVAVLRHMFEGHVDLCSSISDSVMQDLVLAMSVTDFDPAVARVLRMLVYQEGNVIRRNQAPILKSLLDGDELILRCRDVTTGHNGRRNRDKKIAEREYLEPRSKVMFHLEVILTVAYCSHGRMDPNMRTDVRMALFNTSSMEDVFEVVNNQSLPRFFKIPYLQLLNYLYLEDTSLRVSILEARGFKKFLTAVSNELLELNTMIDAANTRPQADADARRNNRPSTNDPASPSRSESALLSEEVAMFWIFRGLIPTLKRLQGSVLKDLGMDDETTGMDLVKVVEECGGIASAMYECFADIVRIYPYQRPPEELIPGQLEEPEPEDESNGFFGGLFGSKKKKQEKERVRWTSPLPSRLRDGSDFYHAGAHKNADMPFDGPPPLVIPLIPIECLKDMAHVIQTFIAQERFEKPSDETAEALGEADPLATVATYVTATPTDESHGSESLQLFAQWQRFCSHFEEEAEGTNFETTFRSAAILILRKGRAGHAVVRAMVRIVDHHLLDDFTRVSVFHACRQIISCEDDDLSDANALITEPEEMEVTPEEEARGITLFEIQKDLVDLEKDQLARQNIFAAWTGEFLLPPKIVTLLGSPDRGLLIAALQCLNELLRDGNQRVQMAILNWAKERSDEDFFVQIRARLVQCRDQLRDRRRAIRREIGDDARRTEKLPKSLHDRLERRFNFEIPSLFLQLVQMLCEGHFLDMQNYFRVQLDNQLSINVLESITGVLEVLVKNVDSATMPLAQQTLSTITELLQGPCPENQVFMVSQNIGDIVTRIFTTHYYDISDADQWQLKYQAITLLQSLMEGHMHIPTITTLMQSLDMTPLVESMDATYREWADARGIRATSNPIDIAVDLVKEVVRGLFVGLGEGDEFKDRLNLATSIFTYLKTILDVETLNSIEFESGGGDGAHELMVDRSGKNIKELFRASKSYKQLSHRVATIEIRRNGKLEKVYFRIPSICIYNLKEESKDNLIVEIKRNGDGERISDFFERSFNLMREMEYYEKMRQTRGLSLVHKYDPVMDNFSLLIAFTINIFLLFTVSYKNQDINPETHIADGDISKTYMALGIIQIIIQCLLFVNFFFGPTLIYLEDCWGEFRELWNRKAVEESKKSMGIEAANVDEDPARRVPFPLRVIMSLIFLLIWPAFYKRAVFLTVAFIGYYFSPIWYCVQMLQIVSKSPLLQNVVKSVTLNWKSLTLTGCLLLVVVYIFSIIAYFNYSGLYGGPDSTFGLGINCDNLLTCTVLHLVYGLKMGGGISELTAPPMFGGPRDGEGYGRLAFDFFFFLILIIMFLNLVFGIILDTFGQLREQREFVEEDQKGKCFICGLDRSEFDRVAPGGFNQHVEFDHHMWDYLFFMHFVRLKPSEDHNGQEGYVAECMEKHEPLFYPVGQSMACEAHAKGEKEEILAEEGGNGPAAGASAAEGNTIVQTGKDGDEGGDVVDFTGDLGATMGGDDGDGSIGLSARLNRLENMLAQILLNQQHAAGHA